MREILFYAQGWICIEVKHLFEVIGKPVCELDDLKLCEEVYLDIDAPMKIGIVEDLAIPAKVLEVSETVAAALTGLKNRSVGAAILSWNYHIIQGQPPEPTLVTFMRRHLRVSHTPTEVARAIPETCLLAPAYMIHYGFEWTKRDGPSGPSFVQMQDTR